MKKKYFVLIVSCCSILAASSQTLFTYGKYKAEAGEFLRAYNKNNTQVVANKTRAISDYLELYIQSRLKIREAYERGYDTLPLIKTEVNNLRAQIVENYLSEPGITERLLKEVFQRSQKDIHVAHIFISLKNATGQLNETGAQKKKDDVLKRLNAGEDFMKIAAELSDDPSAKTNKGDIGFITVFTLPYEFENIVYSTAAGKYSAVYQSKAGYHIFKVLGERKARGRIKAQQILLAIPPGADEPARKKIGALADSLYKRVLKGDDFGKLAAAFSNDYISAASNGTMPDIGVGQYEPAFENVLWSLPKDGAVSKPFTTRHGWHIVKRVTIKPVITDETDKINQQELQQKIIADSRWKISRDFVYDRVNKKPGVEKLPYDNKVLWLLSDSLLDYKSSGMGSTMNSGSPLFKIGDTTFHVTEWITYAQAFRFKQDGSGLKPYEQLMQEFIQASMYNYYRDHLEDYNDEFRVQMSEFRDGNIFFEIMQQEIWNKAQADSTALLSLYNKNKGNYNWKESADAVMFFCADKAVAKTVYDLVKKNPADWRKVAESYTETIAADSSRYEWSQLQGLNKMTPRAGMVTTPLINETDNTASFAYIIKIYPQPVQRNFNDAKGLVINDYQTLLEEQWVEALKKKYPVMIDQKVLAGISK